MGSLDWMYCIGLLWLPCTEAAHGKKWMAQEGKQQHVGWVPPGCPALPFSGCHEGRAGRTLPTFHGPLPVECSQTVQPHGVVGEQARTVRPPRAPHLQPLGRVVLDAVAHAEGRGGPQVAHKRLQGQQSWCL